MKDELSLTIGRRGAQLLFEQLRMSVFRLKGEDLHYMVHFLRQLHEYIEKPPPIHVELTIVRVGGHEPDSDE